MFDRGQSALSQGMTSEKPDLVGVFGLMCNRVMERGWYFYDAERKLGKLPDRTFHNFEAIKIVVDGSLLHLIRRSTFLRL